MSEPEKPDLSPETNPFLRAIAFEARRLAPKPYCVSAGHVGDVLGAPVHTAEGQDRLLEFAEAAALDVGHDNNDGLLFTVRPAPAA